MSQQKLFTMYHEALQLSIKRQLTDKDRELVADIYHETTMMRDGDLRKDILFIIKNRLWRM
jgi:urease accessory protein UreE